MLQNRFVQRKKYEGTIQEQIKLVAYLDYRALSNEVSGATFNKHHKQGLSRKSSM